MKYAIQNNQGPHECEAMGREGVGMKTWSQKLIEGLTAVAGKPTLWRRYPHPKYVGRQFATAIWDFVDQQTLEYAIATPKEEDQQGHVQIECSSAGWTICVFTDYNDAPEGAEEA